MKISLVTLATLCSFIVVGGCVNRTAQQQAKATAALVTEKAVTVAVDSVVRRDMAEYAPITGQLTTDAETSLGAKAGGRLVAVYVQDGDKVSAGQVVAQVDTSSQRIQLSQAASQVQAAQSQLNQALTTARITPTRSLAALNSAKAQLAQARAQLSKAIAGSRPEEKAQAQAALRAAKSNMETAKTARDRQSNLFSQGAVSKQALDNAENAYQAALAQYEQAVASLDIANNAVRSEDIEAAREAVRQAEEGVRTAEANRRMDVNLNDQVRSAQAQLQSARSQYTLVLQQIDDAKVRSSFSGTVLGTPLQVGTVVSPGTPILKVIGASGIYFEGDVPATMVAKMAVGSSVNITVDGATGTFIGRIDALSPAATNVGRVFRARIKFPSFDPALRAGLFARGNVKTRQESQVLTVPNLAIQDRAGQKVVYVVEGSAVREVPVTTGLEEKDFVQVQGQLKEDDKVVVKGAEDLSDKSAIKLAEKAPASTGTQE